MAENLAEEVSAQDASRRTPECQCWVFFPQADVFPQILPCVWEGGVTLTCGILQGEQGVGSPSRVTFAQLPQIRPLPFTTGCFA